MHRFGRRIVVSGVVVLTLAGPLLPTTVLAAFPGAAGRIAYVQSAVDSQVGRIATMKSDGTDRKLLTTAAQTPFGDTTPAWSPGGTMIAFVRRQAGGLSEIWRMDANGGNQRRLTTDSWLDIQPAWSPDGTRIAYASLRGTDFEIFTMDLNGGSVRQLTSNSVPDQDPAWSPDGTKIAFSTERRGFPCDEEGPEPICNDDNLFFGGDIFLMNPDGTSQVLEVDWEENYFPGEGTIYFYDADFASEGPLRLLLRIEDRGIAIYDASGDGIANEITLDEYIPTGATFAPGSTGQTFVYAMLNSDAVEESQDLAIRIGDEEPTIIEVGGDQTHPTWQPVPTFPLVDARFSSFEADIVWVYQEGITNGCSAERYCTKDPVTRAQMATFLARALNLAASPTDYFDDDDGSTHEADINRLAHAGITGGCGVRLYCPERKVTRAEMATFLVRALDLPPTATDYFTDDESTTHEANINAFRAAGLTTGCTATTYCPNSNVTREQMAAFLHRAFD